MIHQKRHCSKLLTNERRAYFSTIPRIIFYLKNRKIAKVLKGKEMLLATGSCDRTIGIFSNSLEYMGYFQGNKGEILSLECLSDNRLASVAQYENCIKIWCTQSKRLQRILRSHERYSWKFLKEMEGGRIVAGYFGGLSIFDIKSGEYIIDITAFQGKNLCPCNSMHLLLTEYLSPNIDIWNIESQTIIKSVNNEDNFNNFRAFPDNGEGKIVAISLHPEPNMKIYEMKNWEMIKKVSFAQEIITSSIFMIIDKLHMIIFGGQGDGSLNLVDYENNLQIKSIQLHEQVIRGMIWIGGDSIITISSDGFIKAFNILTSQRKASLHAHYKPIQCIYLDHMEKGSTAWMTRIYDQIADEYHMLRSEEGKDIKFIQNFSKKLPEGAKIIDVGCGSGYPVHKILLNENKSYEITGIDFSEKQLEKAKELFPVVNYILMDIRSINYPPESFDGIISLYSIFNIPREEHITILKNLYKILKVGGSALIQLGYGTGDYPTHLFQFCGQEHYVSSYSPEINEKLMEEVGFKSIVGELIQDTYKDDKDLFIMATK